MSGSIIKGVQSCYCGLTLRHWFSEFYDVFHYKSSVCCCGRKNWFSVDGSIDELVRG